MNDEDDASVVMGTTSGVKTMADDTLRISFDVEPRFAQLAFKLFGTRGSPVAIARIKPEVAQSHARKEAAKPAGGPLSEHAGVLCKSEPFRQWLRLKYDPMPITSDDAAEIIRMTCHIESRAYLDHVPEAAAIFHEKFRLPYNAWLKNGMKR